jgi:excisionase family DNA binding protein
VATVDSGEHWGNPGPCLLKTEGEAPPTERPSTEPSGDDVWLTKTEAAKYARYSVSTINRAMRAGQLRFVRTPSGKVRIRRQWIDAWLLGLGVVEFLVDVGSFFGS